jgi:hypothetical protein
MARLLSWQRSVLMALASFATATVVGQMIANLADTHASDVSLNLALAGSMVMNCAWGHLIYQIGQKVGYWSPRWQRGWRWAAWLAMFILALSAVRVALDILDPGTGPS